MKKKSLLIGVEGLKKIADAKALALEGSWHAVGRSEIAKDSGCTRNECSEQNSDSDKKS